VGRAQSFLRALARELGSENPREVALAAFLALYTRIDGDTLVLDPIERDLRRELSLVVRGGWIEALAPSSSTGLADEPLSHRLLRRVRESCELVRKLGADRVREAVMELLGDPSDGSPVEAVVERILEVSRDVDRFLEEASILGEVTDFGEAAQAA